jgi:two-component system, OmpR family, alkaline phosphatase synthesis response regulator PhoP
MSNNTILVVNDQPSTGQMLQDYLTDQGFRVIVVANETDALQYVRYQNTDMILLDTIMPQTDGYRLLRQLRQEKHTPVIVISSCEEEMDAVMGLNMGADDFLVKPYRMRELVARISAILRRVNEKSSRSERFKTNDMTVEYTSRRILIRGNSVLLTPLEFDLLVTLMRSPGKVFTREEIIEALTVGGFSGLDKTLNVHVRNLRKKVEVDPGNPQYIETVFGVGYRFHKSE